MRLRAVPLLIFAWIAFAIPSSSLPRTEDDSFSEGDMDLLANLPDDQLQHIANRVLGREWRGSDTPLTFTKAALLSLTSSSQRDVLLSALADFKAGGDAARHAGGREQWKEKEEKEPQEEDEGNWGDGEGKEDSEGMIGMKRINEEGSETGEGRCPGAVRQDFRACGCGDGIWETDYVLDLLSLRHNRGGCPATCDLPIPANVLVAILHEHHNASYWHSQIDLLSNPLILFHNSDDECKCDLDLLREIYPRFQLVIRQYACRELLENLYEEVGNVLVMPLGYGVNFTAGLPAMKVLDAVSLTRGHERRYKWSFQGTLKRNRWNALEVFADLKPNFPGSPEHVGKWELFRIYHESEFVLSGYGDSSVDCFRHYEAVIAGAIPIVVSPMPIIVDAFTSFHDGVLPPWILSETWEEARVVAEELLQDPARLQEMRSENLSWMRSQIQRGKDAVDHVARREWGQACR